MSISTFLFCEATKQAVHVAEFSGDWFRGANNPTVVGAFCFAHVGMTLRSSQAFFEFEDFMSYTLWDKSNVDALLASLAPPGITMRLSHPQE